jgi:hypothetical protein
MQDFMDIITEDEIDETRCNLSLFAWISNSAQWQEQAGMCTQLTALSL